MCPTWVSRRRGSPSRLPTRRFDGWRRLLPQERAKLLRNWYDLILANREDLAVLMTLEQGKPLAEARGEIDYAAALSVVRRRGQAHQRRDADEPSARPADELFGASRSASSPR